GATFDSFTERGQSEFELAGGRLRRRFLLSLGWFGAFSLFLRRFGLGRRLGFWLLRIGGAVAENGDHLADADLVAGLNANFGDSAVRRSGDGYGGLIGLDFEKRLPGLYALARLDSDGHNRRVGDPFSKFGEAEIHAADVSNYYLTDQRNSSACARKARSSCARPVALRRR